MDFSDIPRAILFDLDGTLLDNSDIVIDAYYSGMKKLAYEPKDKEYIRSLLGKSTFETGKALGLADKDLNAIDAYFWKYFGSSARQPGYLPPVYPGVKDLLELLNFYKIPTAIVTSNKAEFATILMEKVHLDKYITAYIGFEHVIEKKPSAEPLYVALKKMNVAKLNSKDNSIWFVGDTPADIQSAINAGVISIAIPETDKKELLKKSGPDYLFESMNELYHSILNLF